ncbi:MAG TPA: cytochrome b [Casimicrobiaceae bacterium]|nr:cytochrome b [Casimicrobiaceae bacterium]
MTSGERAIRYTRTAVVLHWLVAAIVFGQFAFGWLMQQIPKSPPGMRADAFNVHKSIGLCLLALMLVRLGWRIAHPAPPLPAMPRWQARAAKVNHAALYAALIVMPLAGYLGSVWSGYPVKWFGITLPAWGGSVPWLKSLMSAVHLTTSFVLVTLVAVHVGAALWHAARRDGVVARMTLSSARARRPRAAPRVSRAA